MPPNKKQQICQLLKGIETGDPVSVSVVNEAKYIQHNPQTEEGSEGLAELFKRLSATSPRVNIVRVFEDGDFVFAHTEYDFATRNIGFEIFRFEDGQAVEHWDNIQARKGPNALGHSMVDGITEVSDLDKTESNRRRVRSFVEEVLILGDWDKARDYISSKNYMEHDPGADDDWLGVFTLDRSQASGKASSTSRYKTCHRILAEGNFVLCVSEGYVVNTLTALFDLFRVEDGMIVEHWDTREAIPPRSEWKNDNGKF